MMPSLDRLESRGVSEILGGQCRERMLRTIALLRAEIADSASALGWLVDEAAPALAASPSIRSLSVLVATPTPSGPLYDAVIEIEGDVAFAPILTDDDAWNDRFVIEACTSQAVVAKVGPSPRTIGTRPGFSLLSFIAARPEMRRDEVLRHWDEHIPLACEIHWGMDHYVQDRFGTADPEAPHWFGMSHLHFPAEALLQDALFRTPEDRAVIAADVAEFVADHATMLATEHVIRA